MSKIKTFMNEELWFVCILFGFFLGVVLMIFMVPRTRLIDTIPAQQECTKVTVYSQSKSFCKPVEDIR